jgi:murein L,D-transpeptidase YafK
MTKFQLISIIEVLIISVFVSCKNQPDTNFKALRFAEKDSIIKIVVEDGSLLNLDSVEPISQGTNERSSVFIETRIEEMAGNIMKNWTIRSGLKFPPDYILFRVFKQEQEMEIWGGNGISDSLKLIKTLQICAGGEYPTPKLQIKDGKTPEGFYYCDLQYETSGNFVFVQLENNEYELYPEYGNGSAFKIFFDYPNSLDTFRTEKNLGKNSDPGGFILLHANCVSSGCISFTNKLFIIVFGFALKHEIEKYGKMQIHIFPARFSEFNTNVFFEKYGHEIYMDFNYLINFWENIKEGDDLFNKTRKPINFKNDSTKYYFY